MTTIQPMPTTNPWKNENVIAGFGRWDTRAAQHAQGRYATIEVMANDPTMVGLLTLDDIMFSLVWQYHQADGDILGKMITRKPRLAQWAAEYEAVQQPGAVITAYMDGMNLHYHVEVPATAEAPEAPEAPATNYKPGDVANGHVLAVVDGAYQWIPVASARS